MLLLLVCIRMPYTLSTSLTFNRHVAGPQVLNCPGQSYRVFSTEQGAVDYYTDELMLGHVTKVIAPPYLG